MGNWLSASHPPALTESSVVQVAEQSSFSSKMHGDIPAPDHGIAECGEALLHSVSWTAFVERFQLADDTELETAILQWSLFAQWSTPCPRSCLIASSELAELFRIRFRSHGNPDDLEESIRIHQFVLDHVKDNCHTACYALAAVRLAEALADNLSHTSNADCIETALALLEEALTWYPTESFSRALIVNALGVALCHPKSAEGRPERVTRAVKVLREALDSTPRDHCTYPSILKNLGTALVWARATGEAAELQRKAVELCPLHHRERPNMLYALAGSLDRLLGGLETLIREHIVFCREALSLEPRGHPNRPRALCLLGYFLIQMRDEMGHLDHDNLDEATVLLRESLSLLPAQSIHRRALYNAFANILETRIEADHECLHDLDEAIALHARALDLCAIDGWERHGSLHNLARVYRRRYARSKVATDLLKATALTREALALCPPGHGDHAFGVNSLMQCVMLNPHCTMEDLDELDSLYVYVTQTEHPLGHPLHAEATTYLAQVLEKRYSMSGDRLDLARAIKLYREATDDDYAKLNWQLAGGKGWIAASHASGSIHDTLEAYQRVINLLPRYTYLDLGVQLQRMKKEFGHLPVDAAGCALEAGQPEIAVSILEQGRAILWTQLLHLRVSFDGLPDNLVTELTGTARRMEQLHAEAETKGEAGEEHVIEQTTLRQKFDALLQEARAVPGFSDFLLPPAFSALAKVAAHGPVVILVSSKTYGSAAIILRTSSTTPEHLPLPDATHSALLDITIEMRDSVRNVLDVLRESGTSRLMIRKKPPLSRTMPLAMLWRTVVQPVLLAIGIERCTSYDKRPRLWWCCTGPFASLPVHAAGVQGPEPLYASDYVVSSYTPTLSGLINARKNISYPTVSPEMLVVANPETPGHLPLPNTIAEAITVRTLVKGDRMHVELRPRVADVIEKLRSASVIHLACHGTQNYDNPLESGFVLHDGRLTLADLMRLNLPNAFFAFLSACQSAAGDKEQPDESIHLAAGMMFAGFRSVVATLWSMDDQDGPMVAEHVYSKVVQDGPESTFEADRIPFALDKAARKLREDGVHWTRWATYVHIGI